MTRGRRSGMTLVEVLVTLAVVGVMSSVVVLGLGSADRGVTVETEANRLAERLRFAVDETLVTQRPLALAWDERGYGFVTQDAAGTWTPDAQPLLGPRHDLPRGLSLSSEGAAVIPVAVDGAVNPADLRLTGPSSSWRILFDGLNVITASAEGA